MICSRLDKLEATTAMIGSDLRETRNNTDRIRDSLLRIDSGIETAKEMVEALRKNMSAFSKNLFRYLDGYGQVGFGGADARST
jgi:predicted nuclease of restriction endonuclease-like RecB superfamily